jgi:uncharacterized protein YggE
MEVRMAKRFMFAALVVVMVAVLGFAAVSAWGPVARPAVAQAEEHEIEHDTLRTITVVGQGSVRVQPDVARISIGVETSAEVVDDAVAENELKMEAVLDALREMGIEDKDIQTMHYSIQIERYPEPTPRVLGAESEEAQATYRVSNMANVTVRDLEAVGAVLDAVIEAGANNVWGVSFDLDDPEAAQATAREDAVADAKARAGALADLGGVTLGPVMAMSEVIGGGPVPLAMAAERAMGGGGSISPGEVEITYSLQVVYFIEP